MICVLSACAPTPRQAPTLPPPSLAPPRVRSIPLPTPTPFPAALPFDTPLPEPGATQFPDDLGELARSAYGQRLIAWIRIPKIDVFAPVKPLGWSPLQDGLPGTAQWDSPGAAVGWVISSALPDDSAGNVVLYGHNNLDSSVFRNLYRLSTGDSLRLQTGQAAWTYEVSESHILPVLANEPEDTTAYAFYLRSGPTPRLVLISCWPPNNNTHRVVVIALPAGKDLKP